MEQKRNILRPGLYFQSITAVQSIRFQGYQQSRNFKFAMITSKATHRFEGVKIVKAEPASQILTFFFILAT